jgi:ubiquinone/menaquinone biosynthesis C-methylase UbiE
LLVEGTQVAIKCVWPSWFRAYAQATFAGCRVLAAGCGKGGLWRHFGDPQIRVTGCDLDRAALKTAAPLFPVCVGDMNRLSYRAETFDFVTCDWVLEHLANGDLALGECLRVLKSNGILAILTTNPRSPLGLAARLFPRLGHWFWKRSLNIEQSFWEEGHGRHSAAALTHWAESRGMRRVALYRISHMEYYLLNLRSLVPLAGVLLPLVRLYDCIFRRPPFSLLANAYLIVFQKPGETSEAR